MERYGRMAGVPQNDKRNVMNILIIYPFYNQRELMHMFALKLKEYNIFADFICINNYNYERCSSFSWPQYIKLCFEVCQKSKINVLTRIGKRLAYKYFMGKLFRKYDIVDFHAFYPIYNALMCECEKRSIKFDITLWGSDLLRANEERRDLLKYGFNHCFRIKMTSNLYDTMVEYYGSIYSDKYREVYFGSNEIDQIDKISEIDVINKKKYLYGETGNKKIVVCGYNGSCAQNHDRMIDALSRLNEKDSQSVHVVLPMTYGAQPDYLCVIKKRMENLGMSFTILDHFLESNEIAVIRKTANIVVNVQDTDALSDSLKGHLYCENVCIFGEWLNYRPYADSGIYYVKTNMEDIATHITDVLHHYEEYHKQCVGNHERIKSLFSWDSTIRKQVLVYGE